MNTALLLRVFLTWILFLPIPIMNGVLREQWYKRKMGELRAGQFGCILLSLIFILYAYVSLRPYVLSSSLLTRTSIGVLWLVLTLIFEFSIGASSGRSWAFMFEEYKFWEGKLWSLVLLIVLLSPFIVRALI